METQIGKILITGATGLVGKRLVKRLADAGYNCNALVRTGKQVPEGVTAISGDLFDPESLATAAKDVTAVIHLAAVFRSEDTDLIWKSNLEGTINLISAVKAQAPGARFIMASTTHVYDADNPHPGREDDISNPKHAYPASKIAAEEALRESGLNWSVLRFPFVYGDGDRHLEELPKHVMAAGWHPAMKISTVHHRDIANAMKMALQGIMDKKIINITDDATLSVYELLKISGVTMESSSEPLQNPWYLHLDGSLARTLGFRASVRTVYQAAQEKLL
jgi:UDP-glucose 4-epimerase